MSTGNKDQPPLDLEQRLGLIPLHEPAKPEAIIIAVPGLGGGSRSTWTDANSRFFWLQDGLSSEASIKRVALYTFGYLPGLMWEITRLTDVAQSLHSDILLTLDIAQVPISTPIIFVGHSLGGLIVKQLLIRSALSSPSRIHRQTSAVLFFGTPHRGDISPVAIQLLSPRYVADAQRIFSHWNNVNEAWTHISQGYQIVNFYETLISKGPKSLRTLIVPKDQATTNLPGERVLPLNASHRDLVRFSGADDFNYRIVLGVINRILLELPEIHREKAKLSTKPPSTRTTPPDQIQKIDFMGRMHSFHRGKLEKDGHFSVSQIQSNSPEALMGISDMSQDENPQASDNRRLSLLFWVHIPLNNSSWVGPCLQSIASTRSDKLHIMDNKSWLSRERRSGQNAIHSRHFVPSAFLRASETSKQFVLYLPYLHWDSFECFKRRSKYMEDTGRGAMTEMPDDLSDSSKSLFRAIRDDENKAFSLHPRRTLDQYFYSSLPDTAYRDSDQVVYRMTGDSRGGRKLVMVDQLWLWFLSFQNFEEIVLTCFPNKEVEKKVGQDDLWTIADIHQAVIDDVMGLDGAVSDIGGGCDLAGVIMDQAVNAMLNVRNEKSLDFLDIFRSAIGRVTEEQTNYFRKFQTALESGVRDISDPETKRDEVRLALEIADIIDELNIMDRLFEEQRSALTAALRALSGVNAYPRLHAKIESLVFDDIPGHQKQVGQMISDATRAKEALKDLLDLQQKEESLAEAQYSNEQADTAREQADEIAAQSQILLLFTIVTIIFLPLSFFTSYYGMNIVELTGEAGNTTQGAVWTVMGPISGAVITGLLGTALYMYKETRRKQSERRRDKRNSATFGGKKTAEKK
ncbi:hypothetical protein F4778DRAFT_721108 [Xylariomycetidae sp. FL2044]|nr:hypothetical protein F4778DRAFT_721108 [Xylariomycetidae sp. FL2044]